MYSTSTSTVHCTIQSVLLFLGSVQFYLRGGLAHCTVQSVSLCFARLNFIWAGLSPQALMTRRPCQKSTFLFGRKFAY